MRRELRRLNEQITRLAPDLLASPAKRTIEMTMGDGLACHFKATEHNGALYVFAQNMDMQNRGGTATIQVEGLEAGATIEVIDEDRPLTADNGQFTDAFGPLAEHAYRLPLP